MLWDCVLIHRDRRIALVRKMNRSYRIHSLHSNALGNVFHSHGQDDICTMAGQIQAEMIQSNAEKLSSLLNEITGTIELKIYTLQ